MKKRTSLILNIIIPMAVYLIMYVLFYKLDVDGILREKYYDHLLNKIPRITIGDDSIEGNTESNVNNYALIAEAGGYYYYTKNDCQIYRSDSNFNNETALIENNDSSGKDTINVVGDWIFFRHGNKIERIKTDGTGMDTIYRKGFSIDMRVIGNWVYFVNIPYSSGIEAIYKMDVNGQNLQALSEEKVVDMAIYNDRIYYCLEDYDGIYYLKTMNLHGGEKKVLSNIATRNMVVEEENIYYIDGEDSKLYKYKICDSTVEKLSDERVGYFAVDHSWIFYTLILPEDSAWRYKGLYRMDKDGGNVIALDGESYINERSLGLLKDWVLYNSTDGDSPPKLMRIRKDGTHRTTME